MNDLIISLDTKALEPLYEQICDYFRQEIQEGRLAAGMRLPSSRALAGNLMVSRSTVDLAYDQLVSEGYIEAVPCKGYYVCDVEGIYYKTSARAACLETEEKKKETFLYDFAPNGIAPGGFPHSTWRKLSKRVLTDDREELFSLGNPCGELSLRRAIAEYLYRARGVHCTPEQILVGAGNDYLLMLLCTILGRDRKVAMENPTYKSAWHDFRHMGYALAEVGQDELGMDVTELEKTDADVAYVMPSHQFPMGTVMPLKRRLALLKWASEGERYIIEDDYDSEFRYKGKPIPALQGIDGKDRVIYLGTFSKSIAPSIRISYMVLPGELMGKYLAAGGAFSVTVSRADQRILELFLREGHYERHLNRMRRIYKTKHDILLQKLRDMTTICRYSGENAGVHLLLHLINGISEREAVARAKEAGIKVYGLSEFFTEPGPEGKYRDTVLVGYATIEDDVISTAMDKLKEVWSKGTGEGER